MQSQTLVPRRNPSRNLRVLVADDNRDQADSLAYLVASWGYEVQAVYDGLAALESAQNNPPDCALIDLGLPGMDGYQVALHLRRRPELKNVKLVAVTGFDWPSARRRSEEYGFDLHWVKPIDPDCLEKLLTSLRSARVAEMQRDEKAMDS
jgi:CheY-like chemotaxis protein